MAPGSRYIGELPGMVWDPTTGRYYKRPALVAPNPSPNPSHPFRPQVTNNMPPSRSHPQGQGSSSRRNTPGTILPPTDCLTARGKKRVKFIHTPPEPSGRPRTGGMIPGPSRGGAVRRKSFEENHWGSLGYETSFRCGGCHGEAITGFQSFTNGTFYATTDHGKVIIHRHDGETHGIGVCAQSLVGMHYDIPRMTMIAVAAGPEAHMHHFRRDPQNLDHVFMQHSELEFPQGDFYCMASFDDVCTIGGSRSLTSVHYTDRLRTTRRHLPSDVLCLHHHDANVVFAGLRSGSVSLEDLRVDSRFINRVGGTRKGKAVVGVNRVNDAGVPWGLVVSGMGDELLLYDIRFSSQPVRSYDGHINNYQSKLGMTTSSDGKYLFAGGSDKRLRIYNTATGKRIMPDTHEHKSNVTSNPWDEWRSRKIGPAELNPLQRIYKEPISGIAVREDDLGLDLSVKGQLLRFGRDKGKRRTPRAGEDSDSDSTDDTEEL